jgi:hypothetical protein
MHFKGRGKDVTLPIERSLAGGIRAFLGLIWQARQSEHSRNSHWSRHWVTSKPVIGTGPLTVILKSSILYQWHYSHTGLIHKNRLCNKTWSIHEINEVLC